MKARVPSAASLAALATALFFLPVLWGGFIQLDDPRHLMENPAYHVGLGEGLSLIWRAPYFGLYIPVTYTAWKLIVALGGLGSEVPVFDPRLFHALSLLLHAANAALVALILARLLALAPDERLRAGARGPAPLLGALVFALHPVQVESVAWISSTKDLLSSFFALGAVALFLDGRSLGKRPWAYAGASLLYSAALLSKPSAVVVPLICAWIAVAWRKAPLGEALRLFGPWVGLSIPLVLLTKSLQPADPHQAVVSLAARPFVAIDALGFYLGKLALPIGLGIDYGRTPAVALREVAWATGPLLALVTGLGFALRRRLPEAWVGLGLFGLALSPVLGIVPFLFQVFSTTADRYCYLPLVGLALLVAGLVARFPAARVAVPVGAALLAALTWGQLGAWRDGVSVFAHSIRVNPKSVLAHNNLGVEWQNRGRFPEAARHFSAALKLAPHRSDVHSNLGAALVAGGSVGEGLELLHRAEDMGASGLVLFNLAKTYFRLGRYERAVTYAGLLLEKEPGNPRVLRLLALSREALGGSPTAPPRRG